jgi:formylglycine-generating enzyme required for sulfatase activity
MFAQKDLKMVKVEAGSFEMGSDNEQFKDENPKRTVTVNAFYISQYEILFDDYAGFCKIAGYSEPYGEPGFPATNITWERAVMMCNWLSRRDGFNKAYKIALDDKGNVLDVSCDFASNGYRLPTEAEWGICSKRRTQIKRLYIQRKQQPVFRSMV